VCKPIEFTPAEFDPDPDQLAVLARRQRVIELRRQHLSQQAIADMLGIARKTVRSDLKHSEQPK
jgi:DNA-binding CsgD family transcriptional regulator